MDASEGEGGLFHIVEGIDDAGDDLATLVALAGHHQNVAVAQLFGAGADGGAAISDLQGGAGAPARMAWRMAAGSSLRGLSSVTMTKSARSAAASPISGRLDRSRSPPAPKTTISRPWAWGRRACSTVRRPSGVWA